MGITYSCDDCLCYDCLCYDCYNKTCSGCKYCNDYEEYNYVPVFNCEKYMDKEDLRKEKIKEVLKS